MYLKQNNHAPASIELMCGTNRPGLPSMGAWLNYGLGSMNQDLPSFVVLHDTRPRGDDQIWSAGFLPKSYQALALDARRGGDHADDARRLQALRVLDHVSNHGPACQRVQDLRQGGFHAGSRPGGEGHKSLDIRRKCADKRRFTPGNAGVPSRAGISAPASKRWLS